MDISMHGSANDRSRSSVDFDRAAVGGTVKQGAPPLLATPPKRGGGGRFWLTLFTRPILCRIPSTENSSGFWRGTEFMFQFTKYIRDGLPISRGMVVEIVAKRCLEDEMIFFLGMEWNVLKLIFSWSNLGRLFFFEDFELWIISFSLYNLSFYF